MNILIVDDSPSIRSTIKYILNQAGYTNLLFADSAQKSFQNLGLADFNKNVPSTGQKLDLILLDIVLPDLDGREVCRIIKSVEHLRDIPVIMVTALTEIEHLEAAFTAGAMDYITKPINSIELLVRVRSALKLKQEMDQNKLREQNLLELTKQLEKAVEKLNLLSSIDGLTGIANRRRFDEYFNSECKRAQRNFTFLSLIMIDIDYFKAFNDTYGHQAGDECLKTVATALNNILKRPGDLICRYGGEEFAVILPDVHQEGALAVAENMRTHIESLCIEHKHSKVCTYLTISIGVVCAPPGQLSSAKDLIISADTALYRSKHEGRNKVRLALLT
ncbi:MAG: hypothetical protein JM58_05840 [Peptococcaceae bacterium BICA1-8]|nr:MAG: hypothetical protein JM58_05840 [Peptococcaceae bacterium BICA1-8]